MKITIPLLSYINLHNSVMYNLLFQFEFLDCAENAPTVKQ